MKKAHYLAPAVTLLLGLFIFAIFGLFPFSNLTIAWCDMKQQVIPLIIEFKRILSGDGNFFLNLQNGGGMSFIGIFFFFLSSPFTFFLTLFSSDLIYKMVNIAVLLKLVTSACTCAVFFEKNYKSLDYLQVTALSVSYAFCGYSLMYFQNIVWLDMVYLFPLIMHGIFSIVRTGKTRVFTVSFAAALVVHFYLSYMVSLYLIFFTVIFTAFCVKKDRRRGVLFKVAKSVLWAFGLTAAVWIPLMFQYGSSARGSGLISNLQSGGVLARWETTSITVLFTGLIFASLIVSVFLSIRKVRRFSALLICFFLTFLPLVLEPINKMWHIGSYQAFPSRYGFITIFTCLMIAAEVLLTLNEQEVRIKPSSSVYVKVFIVLFLVIVINGVRLLVTKRNELSVYMHTLWFNTDFLSVYLQFAILIVIAMAALMFSYRKHLLSKKVFSIFLCVAVIIESFFNGGTLMGFAGNDITFNEEVLQLSDRIDDEDLYRVKQNRKNFDVNIVGSLGYPTLNHYTSFTDEQYHSTIKKLGYSSYWMEVSSVGGTEFSDIFLGNRYTVFPSDLAADKGEVTYSNDRFALVETEPTASLGFLCDLPLDTFTGSERMMMQEELMQSLTGLNEPVVTRYEPDTVANISIDHDEVYTFRRVDTGYTGVLYYRIHVDGSETLYFDCFNQITTRLREVINDGCNVYVNGELVESEYPSQKNNGILTLGTFTDTNVLVEIEMLKNINAASFGLYGISRETMENYKKAVDPVSVYQNKNTLRAEVSSETDENYFVLSVPYFKGYSVTVNGKKAELLTVFDDFMAVKLQEGENEIVFTYVPQGVPLGFIVSLITTALMAVLLYLKKFRGITLKAPIAAEKALSILFYVLFWAALFMVYLFPFIVRIFK